MKSTQQLVKDHDEIQKGLKILEAVCDKVEAGASVDTGDMRRMVDFIQNYADRGHHSKEEKILFVKMKDAGIPTDGGPVGVMLTEHDLGRNFVKGMIKALDGIDAGAAKDSTDFVKNARGFASLLTEHIFKENNILYPMADSHLSEAQQKEMEGEFVKAEAEFMGPEKRKTYDELIKAMQAKYGA